MRVSSAAAASTAPARVSVSVSTRSSSSWRSLPRTILASAAPPAAVPRTSATAIGRATRPMAKQSSAHHHVSMGIASHWTGWRGIHHHSGMLRPPTTKLQLETATVKPKMPTGRSRRCQTRSFQVDASASSALRRSRIRPERGLR
jgi:hypothetical protein